MQSVPAAITVSRDAGIPMATPVGYDGVLNGRSHGNNNDHGYSYGKSDEVINDSNNITVGSGLNYITNPQRRRYVYGAVFAAIIIIVLFAVLYPRSPTIAVSNDVNDIVLTVGSGISISGKLGVEITNNNVYDIDISKFNARAYLTDATNADVFSVQLVEAIKIPSGKSKSTTFSISKQIDSLIDAKVVGSLTLRCQRKDSEDLLMSGESTVIGLSTPVNFKFGPVKVTVKC